MIFKEDIFIKKVNDYLKTIDFKKLNFSCNKGKIDYAKDVLDKLHNLFVDVYKTEEITNDDADYIYAPAVIQGEKTKKIAVGLVILDVSSAGEHWGSYMFTEKGIVYDDGSKKSEETAEYVAENFVPYKYWYTPFLYNDLHVDFDNIPKRITKIMKNYLIEV